MEKGSFHTSAGIDFAPPQTTTRVQQLDDMVKKIPLPNQLPKGLDFTGIPAPALRSATLESLISQNEDLMARLSVALRKTNQLEERSTVLDRENAVLRGRLDAISDQFLVLQEKDKLNGARAQRLHDEAGCAKMTSEKLEKLYSDLYVQAQKFQRRLVHLERYRARIRKAAPGVQERAHQAQALDENRKALMISHMQSVNSFEAKLNEAKTQIEELRTKASEYDQVFEQKVAVENKLVFEQRQNQITRADNLREIDRLTDENTDLRQQLKASLVQAETQRQELERLNSELPDLHEDQKALREQVESLQALWAHKQREWEQLEEKNRNLQRLNQTLSANLNQQRKELQDQRLEKEKDAFVAQERVKTLMLEIEMLRHQLVQPPTSV